MDLERRFAELTLRAAGSASNPVIEGEAAVFNSETVIGSWFRETIKPGAFKRVLSEEPDVIGAFNHDWNYVLGRTSAGTMTLEETATGLRYAIRVNPADTQAMSVYEKVKRGDVSQSSFAFTVRSENWTRPAEGSGDLALREVVEVDRLYDVGPVPFGAYPEASAQARSTSAALLPKRDDQAPSDGGEGRLHSFDAALRKRQIELTARSIYQSK